MSRTGRVNQVRKLKLMGVCCSASRKQKARAHSSGDAEYYAAASATSEAMAHSSGEAEYAAASATSEAMLIREVLLFMGLEVRIELLLNRADLLNIVTTWNTSEMVTERMDRTRLGSEEPQRKQSPILDKVMEESWKHKRI